MKQVLKKTYGKKIKEVLSTGADLIIRLDDDSQIRVFGSGGDGSSWQALGYGSEWVQVDQTF